SDAQRLRCHPERKRGIFSSRDQRSLAALGMTQPYRDVPVSSPTVGDAGERLQWSLSLFLVSGARSRGILQRPARQARPLADLDVIAVGIADEGEAHRV